MSYGRMTNIFNFHNDMQGAHGLRLEASVPYKEFYIMYL